jgi:hypothetical protein
MILLTESLKRQLPPLDGQALDSDPALHARFFIRDLGLSWFAAEGDGGKEFGSDFIFYGYIVAPPKWWRFTLSELKTGSAFLRRA